ncbi:MAG: protein translocase subunit SecD [Acidimicrobiia bacterium]|nr:protein translocase subunit SecD [Acidimicrobiia bacterium]
MRRRLIGLAVVLMLSWGGIGLVLAQGILPRLGLDLQGGTSVVLTAPEGTDQEVLEQAVEIMRRRIEDVGGVQEPEIAISGSNTVLVQLPGVRDEERALDAIGQTGQLSFRPVLDATIGEEGPLVTTTTTLTTLTTSTTTNGDDTTTTSATTTTDASTTTTSSAPTTTTTLPPNVDPVTGLTIVDDPSSEAYVASNAGCATTGLGVAIPEVLHVGPAALLGSDVADALPGFDPNQAVWAISLDLTADGAEKFADVTGAAAQQPIGSPQRCIAIVLDGYVVAAPAVAADVGAEGITGGRAQITFGNTATDEQEAKDTAALLRYGSLPVSFERSQVQKVSATLGADSLRSGVIAGVIGLVLVALLLIVYYRAMGLVAVVGLTVFASLLMVVFALLGRYQGLTLTLAGVTGVIVSLGITADSYIVYFERIKEEIRAGRSIRSAVDDGFPKAYRTILTADTVSLIGAALLWFLSVGPVKGFALSLGIATILDISVARSFTRRATWLLAHTPLADHGWFSIKGALNERIR